MTRRFFLMAMRFVDNGIHLFFGKRCLAPQLAVGFKFVIRGGVELDPVRSIVNLFADSLACRPGAINRLVIPRELHLRRAEDSLSRSDETHRRDLHARSLEKSAVNGFLDVHIGIAASVAHQIPQARESRPQILLGIRQREQRAVFASIVNRAGEWRSPRLDVVESISEDVRVPVDKSGQHGAFAEVKHLRPSGNLHSIGGAHRRDLFLFDENDLVFRDFARLAIEQAARANRSDLRCLRVYSCSGEAHDGTSYEPEPKDSQVILRWKFRVFASRRDRWRLAYKTSKTRIFAASVPCCGTATKNRFSSGTKRAVLPKGPVGTFASSL